MSNILTKSLLATILLFNVVSNANALDYKQRPKEIQDKIDQVFADISKLEGSNWSRNGGTSYYICNLNEKKIIVDIIKNAPPEQTDFYFVDVGSGEYQWVDSVYKFLSDNSAIPKDKNYHIIGLNGEGKDNIYQEKEKNFFIYKLGGFKIENAIEAFEQRGLKLKGKVSLIVTRMTLIHLIDPVGTFLQLHELTGLNGYLMVSTGLRFAIVDSSNQDIYNSRYDAMNISVEHMLISLNQPYLMGNCSNHFCDFIIHKTRMDSDILPSLSYFKMTDCGSVSEVGMQHTSEQIKGRYNVVFKEKNPLRLNAKQPIWGSNYHGSEQLYNKMKKNNFFIKTTLPIPYVTDFVSCTQHPVASQTASMSSTTSIAAPLPSFGSSSAGQTASMPSTHIITAPLSSTDQKDNVMSRDPSTSVSCLLKR